MVEPNLELMKAIVRRAQYGDEEGIHEAHMKSIREVCANDYTPEQITAWGGREFKLEQKRNLIDNQYVWVVECEGQIEGYGLLFVSTGGDRIDIGGLYFTPKVLGLGLGKKIIDEMKKVSRKLGFKEIFLSSTKTSKMFYQKQGFHQYEKDDVTMIGGVPVEGHPMKIVFDS